MRSTVTAQTTLPDLSAPLWLQLARLREYRDGPGERQHAQQRAGLASIRRAWDRLSKDDPPAPQIFAPQREASFGRMRGGWRRRARARVVIARHPF